MAPTSTPVRPSTTSATAAAGRPAMTRAERDRLTSDLRMACMRISRRVRFESTASVAPVPARLRSGSRARVRTACRWR